MKSTRSKGQHRVSLMLVALVSVNWLVGCVGAFNPIDVGSTIIGAVSESISIGSSVNQAIHASSSGHAKVEITNYSKFGLMPYGALAVATETTHPPTFVAPAHKESAVLGLDGLVSWNVQGSAGVVVIAWYKWYGDLKLTVGVCDSNLMKFLPAKIMQSKPRLDMLNHNIIAYKHNMKQYKESRAFYDSFMRKTTTYALALGFDHLVRACSTMVQSTRTVGRPVAYCGKTMCITATGAATSTGNLKGTVSIRAQIFPKKYDDLPSTFKGPLAPQKSKFQ